MQGTRKLWFLLLGNVVGVCLTFATSYLLFLLFPALLGPYFPLGSFVFILLTMGLAVSFAFLISKSMLKVTFRWMVPMVVGSGVLILAIFLLEFWGPVSIPTISEIYYDVYLEKQMFEDSKSNDMRRTDLPFQEYEVFREQIPAEYASREVYYNSSDTSQYFVHLLTASYFHGANHFLAYYDSGKHELSLPQRVTDVVETAQREKKLPNISFRQHISPERDSKTVIFYPNEGPRAWYHVQLSVQDGKVVVKDYTVEEY